ncbi:hypothetical protein ES703_30275 [subsurface metagenome]
MKAKGQLGDCVIKNIKGWIEIQEGEWITIEVKNENNDEGEVINYTTPGVLTLNWERGIKID